MDTVFFVSGGSAGHLAPLCAVAHALRDIHPDIRIEMICSEKHSDIEFLEKEGSYPWTLPDLKRSLSLPYSLVRSFLRSKKLITEASPNLIFSKGGPVGIPLCYCAYRKNIPIVVHESDAVMGRANRMLSQWATHVCTGVESAVIEDTKAVWHVTGNPIRSSIKNGSTEEGRKITGFSGQKPVLLVLGGSQGAKTLNRAVCSTLPSLLSFCDVIHLTGKGKNGAPPQKGYFSLPFAYEELPHLYALSDIALSRAGAGAISELGALGIASILVPLPGLAQNHQWENAAQVENNNGCILLREETLHLTLLEAIERLASHEGREERKRLAQGIRTCVFPDAACTIAKIIFQSLEEGRRSP